MKKIKVLQIIKSLGRGGAEMLLPETLKLHDPEKFDFHYIYFLPWKDQMEAALKAEGGKVHCLAADNNIQLLLKYKKIMEYCEENQIDLIHCHLPWAGFVGRIVHYYTGIPTLYTEHNLQDRYHFVTKWINRFSFNYQTMAFGVSEDVTRAIKTSIRPTIPVKTLLNGVNTDAFVRLKGTSRIREELEIPEEALVIGTIAVFRFQKRLVEWLRAFKQIRKNNNNVYGIIVGAGPLKAEIEAERKKLGLENIVFLPGLKTDVKPYLSAMDIFMMSSSFEGLPLALLEAMSMECAVIATRAGGIKEVIRDGVDGMTCEVNEWQELPSLCQTLIDAPDKLLQLRRAARERVVQSFSLSSMVSLLEEEYITNSSSKQNELKVEWRAEKFQ